MKKGIIKKRLFDLLKDNPVRMSMPGHKGKRAKYRYDITEILGADNLHHANGIIKEAQDKIAEIYGAAESALLVGSTTTGLQAALLSELKEGERVLLPVNAHRSVYPAISFGRLEASFYTPEKREVGMAVSPEQIKEVLENDPKIKAVVVVSPDYYGNISDIKGIADVVHSFGKKLIVDQAHGAHLEFIPDKESAVRGGADYVVESTHKILGAPTQGAVLHFRDKEDAKRTKKFLSMLESSSPSYMLMTGIEEAIDEATTKAAPAFKRIYRVHDVIEEEQNPDDPMQLITPKGDYDKSKFIFRVKDAVAIEEEMINIYKIIPELAYGDILLCMTGVGTSQKDLNQLIGAIKLLNASLKSRGVEPVQEESLDASFEPYELVMPMQQAIQQNEVFADLDEASGKISSDFVIPYPPGIPLLIPGARITEKIVENLKSLVENNTMITGLDESDGIKIGVVE